MSLEAVDTVEAPPVRLAAAEVRVWAAADSAVVADAEAVAGVAAVAVVAAVEGKD